MTNKRNLDKKPSETFDLPWVVASRKTGKYPGNINPGKWCIYSDLKTIDELWVKVKLATENGQLGNRSKVSTAMDIGKPEYLDKKVICVYTYDSADKDDVMKIREELSKMGFVEILHYKTDEATKTGKYSASGHKNISLYTV